MKASALLGLLFLFIITAFSGCNNDRLKLDLSSKNTYFTQVNMWYSNKTTQEEVSTTNTRNNDNLYSDYTISSTNYQTNNLLPLNTEIKILKATRNKIFFEVNKKVFALVRTKHSKHVSLTDIFQRTFSQNKVSLEQFDEKTKNLIKQGSIEEGMSKDQIILSRGYPPEHRTRSLANQEWYYWHSTHNKQKLNFEKEILKEVSE